MTKYRPATVASNALTRPPCVKCGMKTDLVGIEPEKPGFDPHASHQDKVGRGRRRIVARRLREFFAALLARLSGGSAELFDKAKQASEEPPDKRPP